MSLKESIEQLKPGASFHIAIGNRAAAFVAAKRAGVEIATRQDGTLLWITRKGEVEPELALVERVAALSPKDRLALFESFELCCGMNRGECVCPPETEPKFVDAPEALSHADKLAGLRALMTGEVAEAEPIAEEWQFTSDKPEYHDSGDVYRQQYLVSSPKRRRSVRVDVDNLDRIIG